MEVYNDEMLLAVWRAVVLFSQAMAACEMKYDLGHSSELNWEELGLVAQLVNNLALLDFEENSGMIS